MNWKKQIEPHTFDEFICQMTDKHILQIETTLNGN